MDYIAIMIESEVARMSLTLSDTSAEDLYERLETCSREARVVLDVGCGRGAHLHDSRGAKLFQRVRSRGGVVIGVDVDIPEGGNPHVTELRRIGEDGVWPLDDETVDVAFCDWVLEHVSDPNAFFAECARVLKPGGLFVARTMQRWSVAGLGARVVPRRWHTSMIQVLQPGMHAEDLFPTTLRANTARSLRTLTTRNGLSLRSMREHSTLHGYGFGRPGIQRAAYRVERRLPRAMWHAVVITAAREIEIATDWPNERNRA